MTRTKEQTKDRYNSNKEQFRQWSKEYRLRNPQKVLDRVNTWRQNNPIKTMLNNARNSAKSKELEYNITEEDIIIPTHCPYLNIELTNIKGKGKINTNSSIDRIDSNRGYIKGNVQVISLLANLLKRDATIEELQAFADGINRLHPRAKSTLSTPE